MNLCRLLVLNYNKKKDTPNVVPNNHCSFGWKFKFEKLVSFLAAAAGVFGEMLGSGRSHAPKVIFSLQEAMFAHPHTRCPFAKSTASGAPPPSLLQQQ